MTTFHSGWTLSNNLKVAGNTHKVGYRLNLLQSLYLSGNCRKFNVLTGRFFIYRLY